MGYFFLILDILFACFLYAFLSRKIYTYLTITFWFLKTIRKSHVDTDALLDMDDKPEYKEQIRNNFEKIFTHFVSDSKFSQNIEHMKKYINDEFLENLLNTEKLKDEYHRIKNINDQIKHLKEII